MTDKVVVVGGVGDVLGRAIARRFAREGLVAALVARNAERLDRIASEIRAEGGRAEPFPADMSSESDVVKLFNAVESQLGAFDSAKGALRHLAQSMSHELGPKGIHVATVLIKGAIESERMRRNYPERMATIGPDDTLIPDDIAETYWQIHRPPHSAWSLEADLHPWTEK